MLVTGPTGNTSQPNLSLKEQVPLLSFFTGAGLLDLGFLRHQFAVVWANENSEEFAEAHDYAFSQMYGDDSHSIKSRVSITATEPDSVMRDAFGHEGRPDVFGVIGGPPCPDFSVMGLHQGGEGEHGLLSEVYVQRILALKPTFFVLENVPGLVRIKRHREFFSQLTGLLSSDFHLDWSILDALDYGVPQERRRLFLVGVNRSWAAAGMDDRLLAAARQVDARLLDHWFPWPQPLFPDARHAYQWPTEVQEYGELPGRPRNIPSELMVGPQLLERGLERLPNGADHFRPYSKKFQEVPEGQDCNKSFKRLHRWRYSPTVAYGNNEVHLHPVEARRLTVREAMVLQGLPSAYELPSDMALRHKFKTVANGVPVALAQAVAGALRSVIAGVTSDTALSDEGESRTLATGLCDGRDDPVDGLVGIGR